MNSPIIRIILRYGAGVLFGASVGDALASDVELVNALSVGATAIVTLITEWWYKSAKQHGGAT